MLNTLLQEVWQLSWQAIPVIILVLLVRTLVGPFLTAGARHLLWLLVLARLMIPFLPESQFSLLNLNPHLGQHTSVAVAPAHPDTQLQKQSVLIEYNSIADHDHALAPAQSRPVINSFCKTTNLLGITWLTGAMLVFLRLLISNYRFESHLRHSSSRPGKTLTDALQACRREIGLTRKTELVLTDLVDSPALIGFLHPRILLPAQLATTISPAQLRLVLLHELSHIKSHDVAIDWLWAIVQSVHWFNPALWLIASLRRADREQARDEMVIKIIGPQMARSYGQTLLNFSSSVRHFLPCPGLIGISATHRRLRRRIELIARFENARVRSGRIGFLLIAITASCALTNPRKEQAPIAATAVATTAPTPQIDPTYADGTDAPSADEIATLSKLDQNFPKAEFQNRPFDEVLRELGKSAGTNIKADWGELQKVGVNRDTLVRVRVRQIKFSKVLDLIFKSVENEDPKNKLAYMVHGKTVTISTQGEINHLTICTRRYEIADLWFSPKPSTLKQQVAEIKRYVMDNVDTPTWKANGGDVGTIDIDPQDHFLLVSTTPERQQSVKNVLQALRDSRRDRSQTEIEIKLFTINGSDISRLPPNIQQRLAAFGGADIHRSDQFLSSAEVRELVGAFTVMKTASLMTIPRLTNWDGQHATVVVNTQQAYVDSMSVTSEEGKDKSSTVQYHPHAATTNATGLELDCQMQVTGAGRDIRVDLDSKLTILFGLLTEQWPGTPAEAHANVQRPVSVVYDRQLNAVIPNQRTLIVSGFTQTFTDTRTKPQAGQAGASTAIDAEMENHRQKRVYLLVTPTIVKSK